MLDWENLSSCVCQVEQHHLRAVRRWTRWRRPWPAEIRSCSTTGCTASPSRSFQSKLSYLSLSLFLGSSVRRLIVYLIYKRSSCRWPLFLFSLRSLFYWQKGLNAFRGIQGRCQSKSTIVTLCLVTRNSNVTKLPRKTHRSSPVKRIKFSKKSTLDPIWICLRFANICCCTL